MPRPYQVLQNPVFTPYVCIQCGVGAGRREWFVDLGFPIDQYFNMDNHAIYLCNECYNGMTLDIGRLLLQFRQDHESWEGGEEITYTFFDKMEKQNDVRESESGEQDSGVGTDQLVDATTASSSDRNDQDTESNDSESEPTDSGDADSTDDSNSDESTGLQVKFGSS